MKILCINTDNTMEEFDVNTSLEDFLVSTNIDGLQLLYYWNYGNKIIKCYGLYVDNYSNINSHSLPPNGISSVLEEDSDNIILSAKIYIVAFDKNRYILSVAFISVVNSDTSISYNVTFLDCIIPSITKSYRSF